jgi:hypothetical protein
MLRRRTGSYEELLPSQEGLRPLMLTRIARIVLWIPSALVLVGFAILEVRRLPYPLEFGYGEGLLLHEATRAGSGLPIYTAPSLQNLPLAYMPGAMLVAAPLTRWFGPQFWEGRLLPLISTVVLVWLIAYAVRCATSSWTLGVAGAALFLMGQGTSGIAYDEVRPDLPMLAFVFGGIAILRFRGGHGAAVAAAALIALGFFIKQHALFFGAAMLPHLFLNDRRRLVSFGIALLVFCLGGYLLLSMWMGPWFSFYVYEVPSHWSSFNPGRVLHYARRVLRYQLAPLSLPTCLTLVPPGRPWAGPDGIWLWATAGGIGTGLLATLDPFAASHVLIPTIAVLALIGPISLHRVAAQLGLIFPAAARSMPAVACLALMLAFACMRFPIRTLIPEPLSRAQLAGFYQRLGALPGQVLMPFHGSYAPKVGKGTSLSVLALDDVIRSRGNSLLARDPGYIERMFDSLRRGPGRPTVVLDLPLAECGEQSEPLWASLAASYRLAGELPSPADGLERHFGKSVPRFVYLPVEPPEVVAPRP